MDATPPTQTPPTKRRLGHLLHDTFIHLILRNAPRQILQNATKLFTSFSYLHRAFFIFTPILFAIAEYELPGFLPTIYELPICMTAYTIAGLLVFAGITVLNWLETAVWPWQESGWVWPWERWFWGANLTDSEFSMSTVSLPEMEGLGSLHAAGEKEATVQEVVNAQRDTTVEFQGSTRASNQDEAPTVAFRPAGVRSTLSPPATPTSTARTSWVEGDILIPPTPQLPHSMRSGSMLPPPTPADIHRSGLLGESPMPPRFSDFGGVPFARRADAKAATNEWMRSGATKTEKARAKKVVVDIWEFEREEEGSV
ncbi:hypothetical protein NX059_004522 [Plenodomus lindquistii]|nr:hypothetical protein NX059_004522 [Plenodomus lindquistii]